MPKNSKSTRNTPKSNAFELLNELDDDKSITVEATSTRGWPLKRTQPFEPNLPPRAKRTNSTKATASKPALATLCTDEWTEVRDLLKRVETALATAEHGAEKAEKRIEGPGRAHTKRAFPTDGTNSLHEPCSAVTAVTAIIVSSAVYSPESDPRGWAVPEPSYNPRDQGRKRWYSAQTCERSP
ncbi:hypothetical protein F5884DRAFT_546685 [Xylogone sp. PMI_703]|nr:hypothetical protein F5884DRAFT_546685 [Xylogone sp. PMI_703]